MDRPRTYMTKGFTEHVREVEVRHGGLAAARGEARQEPRHLCEEHAHPLVPLQHTRFRDLHGVLNHGARVAVGKP
jgi:hypothetical protein